MVYFSSMVAPVVALVAVVLTSSSCVIADNTDRFNYGETDTSGAYNDYGPSAWSQVSCSDKQTCAGYPDQYIFSIEWNITDNGNTCKWCPKGQGGCGVHHQSPINLKREVGIEGHENENECIDVHWMKYEDSSCTWDQLVDKKAFSIERHALKMTQPVEIIPEVTRLDCPAETGRKFGRIDFSKGFSAWWFLSHIDFKVPSEHTQDGKRYSAEVQMAHFYSLGESESNVGNQMAHVSIFLEAYDDAVPYGHLDRVICQWRRAEDETRELCGLPSVQPYPGCFPYSRGHTESPTTSPTVSPRPTGSPPTAAPIEDTESPTEAPITEELAPVVPEIVDPVGLSTDAPFVVPPPPSSTSAPVIPATLAPSESLTSAPFAPLAASGTEAPAESLTSAPFAPFAASGTLAPAESLTSAPFAPFAASGTLAPVVPVTPAPSTFVAEAPIVPSATTAPVAAANPSTSQGRYLRTVSAHDVIRDNYSLQGNEKRRLEIDEMNFRDADWTDQQWEEWIEDIYNDEKDLKQIQEEERELLEGAHLSFHNYQFLIDSRTEYYFRYSGTQTVPPCWGPYTRNTRANTNHWRVMKDPIRVHPRQIAEMERLLKNRIAPPDDPFRACQVDTAGAIDEDGHISVARPLQDFSLGHYMSFCECKDWPSKWPEDRAWCEIQDTYERLYDHPYHFATDGL